MCGVGQVRLEYSYSFRDMLKKPEEPGGRKNGKIDHLSGQAMNGCCGDGVASHQ